MIIMGAHVGGCHFLLDDLVDVVEDDTCHTTLAPVRRNPLDDTVRHSVIRSLQDETCNFRGFVLAEALVHKDEPCHLRVFKLCPL